MIRTLTTAFAFSTVLACAALAEVHEVEMLNRNDARETMVFNPAFLRVAAGDTVKFVAANKGHNVESIAELWPEGVDTFAGKVNEEVEYTFDAEGFYAVKCKPHFAMGMVMTIAVGDDAVAPDGWLDVRLPPKTKERLEAQIAELAK